jgi:hypothetical protein
MRHNPGTSLVILLAFFSVLILVPRPPVSGQSEAATCLPVVEDILSQVGENCSSLTRNSACYGYVRTESTFNEEVAPDYFTEPSDRTDVTTLKTIYTAPLSADGQEWGVTVMSLQANIPNTIPGQNVKFILFGDVSLENAVEPEDTFTPMEVPITVTTHAAANIRSQPSINPNNVKSSVPDGVQLAADAISGDGQWLRVTLEDNTLGWVNVETVDIPPGALDQFPVLSAESRTPMQAIYLTTGFNDITCNEAPPVLVIQAPQEITVDLSINGVDITVASTLIVRLTNSQSMEFVTIDGSVTVDGVSLPPGFSITASLAADGRSQDGAVHDWRPLTEEELNSLVALPLIPLSVLNYPIRVPTISDVNQVLVTIPGQGSVCGRPAGPAAGSIQCSSLCPTSPLDAWGPQATTFYWDAAPGATGYRLNILSSPVVSIDTSAGQTNATQNLTGLASDGTLSWTVNALYNGQVACTSEAVVLQRDISIQAPGPAECPASATC